MTDDEYSALLMAVIAHNIKYHTLVHKEPNMPYIQQDRRDRLKEPLLVLLRALTTLGPSPGDVNYVVSVILASFYDPSKHSYNGLNTGIGILECAKLELYRKLAAPYEDAKEEQNGKIV